MTQPLRIFFRGISSLPDPWVVFATQDLQYKFEISLADSSNVIHDFKVSKVFEDGTERKLPGKLLAIISGHQQEDEYKIYIPMCQKVVSFLSDANLFNSRCCIHAKVYPVEANKPVEVYARKTKVN
jgi:hypothetical protein